MPCRGNPPEGRIPPALGKASGFPTVPQARRGQGQHSRGGPSDRHASQPGIFPQVDAPACECDAGGRFTKQALSGSHRACREVVERQPRSAPPASAEAADPARRRWTGATPVFDGPVRARGRRVRARAVPSHRVRVAPVHINPWREGPRVLPPRATSAAGCRRKGTCSVPSPAAFEFPPAGAAGTAGRKRPEDAAASAIPLCDNKRLSDVPPPVSWTDETHHNQAAGSISSRCRA